MVPFQEPDGQRYQLVSDENNEGMTAGEPWELSPVPAEHAVYGLGPVEITVSDLKKIQRGCNEFIWI